MQTHFQCLKLSLSPKMTVFLLSIKQCTVCTVKSTGKIEITITCICFRSSPHTGRKKPKKKKSMLEERPLLDPGPPPSGKLGAIKRDKGQGHSAKLRQHLECYNSVFEIL